MSDNKSPKAGVSDREIDNAISVAKKYKAAMHCQVSGLVSIHVAPLAGGETEWRIEKAGEFGPRMIRQADGEDRVA
jgi:hypothetical protein